VSVGSGQTTQIGTVAGACTCEEEAHSGIGVLRKHALPAQHNEHNCAKNKSLSIHIGSPLWQEQVG
jgi:hypothetical protein